MFLNLRLTYTFIHFLYILTYTKTCSLEVEIKVLFIWPLVAVWTWLNQMNTGQKTWSLPLKHQHPASCAYAIGQATNITSSKYSPYAQIRVRLFPAFDHFFTLNSRQNYTDAERWKSKAVRSTRREKHACEERDERSAWSRPTRGTPRVFIFKFSEGPENRFSAIQNFYFWNFLNSPIRTVRLAQPQPSSARASLASWTARPTRRARSVVWFWSVKFYQQTLLELACSL